MTDRVHLQQVFMNLMLNGIDAMKGTTGGGELTIKSEAGDAQLLVSVSDTGVGLPDQIFKAFFTTKDKGTGCHHWRNRRCRSRWRSALLEAPQSSQAPRLRSRRWRQARQ